MKPHPRKKCLDAELGAGLGAHRCAGTRVHHIPLHSSSARKTGYMVPALVMLHGSSSVAMGEVKKSPRSACGISRPFCSLRSLTPGPAAAREGQQ